MVIGKPWEGQRLCKNQSAKISAVEKKLSRF